MMKKYSGRKYLFLSYYLHLNVHYEEKLRPISLSKRKIQSVYYLTVCIFTFPKCYSQTKLRDYQDVKFFCFCFLEICFYACVIYSLRGFVSCLLFIMKTLQLTIDSKFGSFVSHNKSQHYK